MSVEPFSLLVFRNGSIGNTLAAVPALRALRHRYPNARVSVVVDSTGWEMLRHCPWIDRLIRYDKRSTDRSLFSQIRLIRELRAQKPSHAVLFKRFFRNGLLSFLSGARVRAGFVTDGKAPFLNRTLPYDESRSIVDLNLDLAALLDAPSCGRHYELFLSAEDRSEARAMLDRWSLHAGTFGVAHYGGSTTAPDFVPLPRFVQILSAAFPDRPILLMGNGPAESAWAEKIAAVFPQAILACGMPIRTSAALMADAAGFVGFNSGPAHVAAAVHIPQWILYRPDLRVEQEIRKWLPPSDLARPLVPPLASEDAPWQAFIANAFSSAHPDTRRGS